MITSGITSRRLVAIPTHQDSFSIDLDKTALLIIDMQNDFCHPDGFCGDVLKADVSIAGAIIPQIQTVLNWARKAGILVVFTRESHAPDLSDLKPSKKLRYENAKMPIGAEGKMGRYLVQGEKGTEIVDELQPLPNEIQLDKPEHSAFASTNLDEILQNRGITHLLITGVTTECCVLGTYRQGSDLGYYCLLLEDCCAAFEESHQQAAIAIILAGEGVIGWVTSSDILLQHAKVD